MQIRTFLRRIKIYSNIAAGSWRAEKPFEKIFQKARSREPGGSNGAVVYFSAFSSIRIHLSELIMVPNTAGNIELDIK